MMNDIQMREGGEFRSLSGGGKKFLYAAPVSSKGGHREDDQWPFATNSKTNSSPRGVAPIDLDNVWSIRNVALGSANGKSVRSEPSTLKSPSAGLNTSSVYYSRYGGMKGSALTNGAGNRNGLNSGTAPTGTGATSWASSGHSYGQNNRQKQPPTFQRAPDRLHRESSRLQSPFTKDINDF